MQRLCIAELDYSITLWVGQVQVIMSCVGNSNIKYIDYRRQIRLALL